MHWLWLLSIGLVAGWLAGKITPGSGFGIVGDIVIGMLGSAIGGHLCGLLGIAPHGLFGKVGVATVGAIALVYVARLVKRA